MHVQIVNFSLKGINEEDYSRQCEVIASALYKGMLANPHFDDIAVRDFAVLENPTRVTHGTTEVAA